MAVLKLVKTGNKSTSACKHAKIGRVRGWKKQHVAYYVRKLEKANLICRVKRSSFVDYELTERGQNFLVSCEGLLFTSGVFRLHRCFFKFPIIREGVYPMGDFKRVEMQNWTALLGLEQGIKVLRRRLLGLFTLRPYMVAALESL
jgi:predicted transcriptional regulator